jgi:hypothetical protein
VKIASPKPAWAHVYYIGFHDPANSSGPTEGFYPVFLLATDRSVCWLSVCLAAGGFGISGRGGWSKIKGEMLKQRASLLGSLLTENDLWQKGPIQLGPDFSYLHRTKDTTANTGRAYECGAIISTLFNPHDPPDNLSGLLISAFGFYDRVLDMEASYLESALPPVSDSEWNEQVNASITGSKAEFYVSDTWFRAFRSEWGTAINKTNSTGLGYDFEFPEAELFVEVKGFRHEIEDIRLTALEWRRAEEKGDKFILCLVSQLDGKPKVDLIVNPHKLLSQAVVKNLRIQTTYSISKRELHKSLDSIVS